MRHNNKGFIIPYESAEGEPCMIRFRFYGDVDHRRVRRMIQKNVRPMGMRITKAQLDWLIKHRNYDIFGNREQDQAQSDTAG